MKSFQFAIAFLICLFTIIFFHSEAHAATTTNGDYEYEILNDGRGDYIQILDYKGTSTSIVIPSEIEVSPGRIVPLKSIGDNSFRSKGLTNITLSSNALLTIGQFSFSDNPIEKFTFDFNCDTCYFNAFSNTSIKELYMPDDNKTAYFLIPYALNPNLTAKIYADQYTHDGSSPSNVYQIYLGRFYKPTVIEFIDTKLITFNYDDGNTVNKKIQNIATTLLTEPTTPSRPGYTFDGWYDGTSKWNFATDKVTKIMTLQAKWSPKTPPVTYYNVTFLSNTDTSITSQQIAKSSYVKAPEVITKKGYTFAGWYDGENKWYFLSDTISKDTTLSAKWKLNDYKMTFDSIGG
ncbi:InlB B-repeat-containing protein, partial [Kurthia sibirica]